MEKLELRLREGMAKNGITGKAADEIIARYHVIRAVWLSRIARGQFRADRVRVGLSEMPSSRRPSCAAMLNCYPLGFYHPATLVKDAQRHGVEVRPIDVTRSNWRCTIGKSGAQMALRLGLKYISGLREETGLRIESERRARPFRSIADLIRRAAPNRRELDTLAYAGALSAFGKTGARRCGRPRRWSAIRRACLPESIRRRAAAVCRR